MQIDHATLEALAARFITAEFANRLLSARARAAVEPDFSATSFADALDIPEVVANLLWNFAAATVLADYPSALDIYAAAERKAGVH